MVEFVGKSLLEIHKKGVSYILQKGEKQLDQNNEKTLTCHNLHFVVDSQDCNHVPMGATTRELDIDFAAGVCYPGHARLRGENFDYGYGWLMWSKSLIEKAITILKKNPNTRRVYIPLFWPEHLGSKKEIPCCVGIQFETIDDSVAMTAVFRSNDCGQASPSDDFGLRCLQKYVAFKLGKGIGKYCRYVVNAHLKLGDADKFERWEKGY